MSSFASCGWCIAAVVIGAVVVGFSTVAFIFTERVPKWRVEGKRILITGGSSGIGLATAKLLAEQGAFAISIIARDQKKIDEAIPQIKGANGATQVYSVSADVSKQVPVQAACERAIEMMGGIDAVICCAGASYPALFIATAESDFDRLMQINYSGIVYTLKTCVPHLIRNKGGRIMLVSSMAGLTGVAGYTAYSASKFALRGLAESLHMELNEAHNISVSLCSPPDVDTPMLAAENEIKPKECLEISSGSGLFTSQQIANDMVDALKQWRFLVNTGMDGKLLALLASGTSPAHSGFTGTLEFFSLGLIRIVSLVYRWSYNRIVLKVHRERVKGSLKDTGATAYDAIVGEREDSASDLRRKK